MLVNGQTHPERKKRIISKPSPFLCWCFKENNSFCLVISENKQEKNIAKKVRRAPESTPLIMKICLPMVILLVTVTAISDTECRVFPNNRQCYIEYIGLNVNTYIHTYTHLSLLLTLREFNPM